MGVEDDFDHIGVAYLCGFVDGCGGSNHAHAEIIPEGAGEFVDECG